MYRRSAKNVRKTIFAAVLLHTSTAALSQIVPDSSESYTSCPACELSYDSDVSPAAANESFAIVSDFVDALSTRKPEQVQKVFCDDGILWGTVSQQARYTPEEIYSYFDYFAREDNEVLSACPQVLQMGSDLYKANVAVNNSGSCLRMSFTVNVKDNCIAYLYSSYFPNDPEDLRKADLENDMPWSGDTLQTGTLPDPATALGDCKSCDLTIRGDIPDSDVTGVEDVMNAWVDGLLAQNSTAIADTYCPESSFLWGTVSNMRRNTYDEIKSYFDWFATSRNFTEEIKSVCPTLSMLSDQVFVEDRELRLGEQCLRMSYTITNENGTYCIKSLSSSFFPEEPAGLVAADARNLNPSPSPPSPTASATVSAWIISAVLSVFVFTFLM